MRKFQPLIISAFFLGLCFFLIQCQKDGPESRPFLIGQGIGIGSTTLLVEDIESARAYFIDTLGFNIYREISPSSFDGYVSTSIILGDLTSFEIISPNDSSFEDKKYLFAADDEKITQGVRFFSLSSSSVDSTFNTLVSAGFQPDSVRAYRVSASMAKGWSGDDGGDQRRSLDFDANNPPALFPRFIESIDYGYADVQKEWKTYYLFRRMYNKHPNGVLGISALKIATKDLESMADKYQSMGFESIFESDSLVKFSVFRHQEIYLVDGSSAPELDRFLLERGEGVYAVQFDVKNLDSTYHYLKSKLPAVALEKTSDALIVSADYAFGVQLEFVQEPAEQSILARTYSPSEELDSLAVSHTSFLYTKYCALCHGENREGYAADNAPSLRSKSLLSTSMDNNFMRYTIQYGRSNTAMAGYLDAQGGPLEYIEVELILKWLSDLAEVKEPVKLSREPVKGDIELGSKVYSTHCATCHGANGEGVSAPALGNPMTLATATDHFLRYAIAEGRDGTPMIAFKEILNKEEIDGVVAFLRSRSSGWDIPKPIEVTIPTLDEYILNPEGESPTFDLREGKYVSAAQVNQALKDKKRMIILDARSEVAWRQMHIPGAIPVPYYKEPETFINDIPNDGTQVVIYCACPHAASGRVQSTLRRHGFENTAIIDEGILVWAQLGFPVRSGS